MSTRLQFLVVSAESTASCYPWWIVAFAPGWFSPWHRFHRSGVTFILFLTRKKCHAKVTLGGSSVCQNDPVFDLALASFQAPEAKLPGQSDFRRTGIHQNDPEFDLALDSFHFPLAKLPGQSDFRRVWYMIRQNDPEFDLALESFYFSHAKLSRQRRIWHTPKRCLRESGVGRYTSNEGNK